MPAGGARAAVVPVGKKQRLVIERLANDGRGIAFVDKRTWFVSNALVAEEVEARVLTARANVVEARAEKILSTAEERIRPACRHADSCGGCSLQHMPHDKQLLLKQNSLHDQFSRAELPAPEKWAAPLSDAAYGYRRRARLAVRFDHKTKHLSVGFRAQASQTIVDIAQCPILEQSLERIVQVLPQTLRALKKPAHLGHVELFAGDQTSVLVRLTQDLPPEDIEALATFCRKNDASLWLQRHEQAEPYALGDRLSYSLEPALKIELVPGDFVQVNQRVNQKMIHQALEWLAPKPSERILDLFCGLGNFALPLALRAKEVIAVEGVAGMVQRAQANALANGLTNVHFHHADLNEPYTHAAWAQGGFAAVLLDPPRDGALEVTRNVAQLGAKRIVYVSCNPATLARDAAVLVEHGYRLERAGMLDMFPQTAHVEAMALFVQG